MFGVWVNTTTGKRFISELANRKLRADAIMNFMNHGQKCIAIARRQHAGRRQAPHSQTAGARRD